MSSAAFFNAVEPFQLFLSPNQRASIIYQVVPRKRFVKLSIITLQKQTQTSPLSSENKSHLAGI